MKGLAFTVAILAVTGFVIFLLSQLEPKSATPDAEPLAPVPITYTAAETLAAIDGEQRLASLAAGEALFKRHQCIGCHMDDSRALKRLHALGNKYNLPILEAYLKRPNPPMPVFPLSDAERRQLAIYLIDRYPGRERPPETTAAGG
jgi:mono/diheme cytochrome c family protein